MTQPPIWDRRTVPTIVPALIARLEGCRLSAYKDSVGNWTIGFGSLHMPDGSKVRAGDHITQDQANGMLVLQCEQWVRDIVADITAPLTEPQAAALISFVHNLGGGSLAGSTLAKMANGGDMLAAGHQFNGWAVAGGQVVLGLLRRGEYQRRLFAGEAVEGQAAYNEVWLMDMHDLMPLYQRAFAEARAWGWQPTQAPTVLHAGSALAKPVPQEPQVSTAGDATEDLNEASLRAAQGGM